MYAYKNLSDKKRTFVLWTLIDGMTLTHAAKLLKLNRTEALRDPCVQECYRAYKPDRHLPAPRIKRDLDERHMLALRLAQRFGWVCWYCGLELTKDDYRLDQMTPQSCGSQDEDDNLALACACCHLAKRNKPVDTFLEWLAWVRRGHCPILECADATT